MIVPTSQHVAILGKTGSGKTFAAKGIVEGLLDEGARVCVIDPTGAWHGMRSSATGKRAGYPVVIFGGSHADLPLGGAHGEAMAEIIGTTSTPAILDTSAMRVGERTRFFADFADAMIRKNKGPLHLIIDEAHLFAPQGRVNDPQSGAMLHAANNLVSLGRSRGLRIILISQRPAKLHKDSLTQVETLVAMRLIAPQDRRAVQDWIEDNADEAKGREIIESLATLKTGQGWVWAPEASILERVSFPKIKTYDSSRAPDGSEVSAAVLAPIDKDAIATKLETVAKDAMANDPARLKREIAELRQQLAKAPTAHTAASAKPNPRAIIVAEHLGFRAGFASGVHATKSASASVLAKTFEALTAGLQSVRPKEPEFAPRTLTDDGVAGTEPLPARILNGPDPHPRPAPKAGSQNSLPKGERLCLIAIAQHHDGVTREQLTVLTEYKRSTRDAYIQRLRERGYVNDSGRITATQDGIDALGPGYEPLPTGIALRQRVLSTLPEGERACLAFIIEQHPSPADRDQIGETTGYKRSTRDAYLQRLSARELVTTERGVVRASDNLFD